MSFFQLVLLKRQAVLIPASLCNCLGEGWTCPHYVCVWGGATRCCLTFCQWKQSVVSLFSLHIFTNFKMTLHKPDAWWAMKSPTLHSDTRTINTKATSAWNVLSFIWGWGSLITGLTLTLLRCCPDLMEGECERGGVGPLHHCDLLSQAVIQQMHRNSFRYRCSFSCSFSKKKRKSHLYLSAMLYMHDIQHTWNSSPPAPTVQQRKINKSTLSKVKYFRINV